MTNPENIPLELRQIPHWVTWTPRDGKKVPDQKINEPGSWLPFEEAIKRKPDHLGFVFNGDGHAGLDLDACREPQTGNLTDWAKEIIQAFPSYVEVSPSGTGVKIFLKDSPKKLPANVLPMPGEPINGKRPALEAYSTGRYFTVTGHRLPDSPAEIKSTPNAWLWLIQKMKGQNPTPSEGRNNTLTSLAGAMRRKGADEKTILAALQAENQNFESPLSEKELTTIARSISKYSPVSQEQGFAFTDTGNGDRLKARHGKDLLYCYPWKTWLVWDGRRFKTDDNGEAVRRAKETAFAIFDEAKAAAASGNEEKAKTIARHAMTAQQKGGLESMLWAAQSELPVKVEELDQSDQLLNLENGTLDLKTLTLSEHRREDKLTKLSPVVLDGKAECALWLKFLDRVLGGDKELISFIQRACGYSLTGSTEEQVFFLLHGEGANGKSTFIQTLLSLLGEYARPTEFKALLKRKDDSGEIRNDLAALVGVRFVSAVEVGEGKQLDEAIIKQITGGDTITARFLHKEFFDFKPHFKLWLAANSKPEIHGTDYAIWRRVLLIPFEITIPEEERDKNLGEKLKVELPGILNWAVEGLRVWNETGLKPPEKVTLATAEYRKDQDLLAPFIESCFVKGEKYFCANEEFERAYRNFTGNEPPHPKTLARLLRAHGFKQDQRRVNGGVRRGWVGLGLKSQEVEGI